MTGKQAAFVREYLVDLNATAAYKRAGYKCKNDHVAEANAHLLMRNHEVAVAIDDAMFDRAERVQVSADDVLRELKALAFSDVGDIIDHTGDVAALKPANQIPKRARRAIASVKVKRYVEGRGEDAVEVETQEFRLWSKLDALDKLMKHLGLAKEPLPLEVLIGYLPSELASGLRGELAGLLRPGCGVPSGDTNGHALPVPRRPEPPDGGGGNGTGPVADGPPALDLG